jgi:hypothetical protein
MVYPATPTDIITRNVEECQAMPAQRGTSMIAKKELRALINRPGPSARILSYSPRQVARRAQRFYEGLTPGMAPISSLYVLRNGIAQNHQLVHLRYRGRVLRGVTKSEVHVLKAAPPPNVLATRFIWLIGKPIIAEARPEVDAKTSPVVACAIQQTRAHLHPLSSAPLQLRLILLQAQPLLRLAQMDKARLRAE